MSTALQLAAVYSEPFGFLPSSGTRPSDRHWAELLAADPMFDRQAALDRGAYSGASESDGPVKYESHRIQQQGQRGSTPKKSRDPKVGHTIMTISLSNSLSDDRNARLHRSRRIEQGGRNRWWIDRRRRAYPEHL